MISFVVKKYKPIVSPKIRIIAANIICICIEHEKTLITFALPPFPNSNVINLLIDEDSDPDSIENIATTPPTTL